VRNTTGAYTLTLNAPLSSPVPVATTQGNTQFLINVQATSGSAVITIDTFDLAGTPTDSNFYIAVFNA
jgi:hypothetical protein